MLAEADAILKANPEPKQPAVRVRYRGGRPTMTWLRKHDEQGAAALWLLARDRLPPEADNDNEPTKGKGVDRRKDGKPRGRDPDPRSLDAYLALPAAQPRLGDPEPRRICHRGWDGESRGIAIKPQRRRGEFPSSLACSYTICTPAIAPGAFFLGAVGGLGQLKVGKQRGDVRRVDAADLPTLPTEVEKVIEVILSGGNVADVGRAFGARGGYADRRGAAALLQAGRWAKTALAA
jgi:hypothetical protein